MNCHPVAKSICSIALPAFVAGCLVGALRPDAASRAQPSEAGLIAPRPETLAAADQSSADDGRRRNGGIRGGGLAESSDSSGLLAELADGRDPGRRQEILRQMMGSTAPEAWAALAQDLDPWIKPYERQLLLATWAGVDARGAIRHVKERDMVTRDEDFKVIADVWAGSNPQEVLAAVRDDPEGMDGFGSAAVQALAGRDVASAAEALLLIKPHEAGEAVEVVVARMDPQAVEHLIQQVGPSEEWAKVRAAGYSSLVQAKVATATVNELQAWAETRLGDDAFVHGGLQSIAESLERADALVWLSGLSLERAPQESVVLNVYSQWLDDDSIGATAWLLSHPDIPAYDQAVAQVANTIAVEDPAGASAWAATIRDPQMRQGLLDSLYANANNPE